MHNHRKQNIPSNPLYISTDLGKHLGTLSVMVTIAFGTPLRLIHSYLAVRFYGNDMVGG